ncbi:MAG: 50S ribosomal protein L4 [Patescibacteria group bacterium]|jgi:large subunit ribosomal protein L4
MATAKIKAKVESKKSKVSVKTESKVVETKTIQLPKELFGVTASDKLLAQYVRVFLNNLKPTTSYSKTRGEVSGTTKKLYKQKGTGRARHGSAKAPIFVGGGTAHGAKNEVVKLKMMRGMRRKALFYALTLKAKAHNVQVVEDTGLSTETKTAIVQKKLLTLYPENKKTLKVLTIFPHAASGRKAAENIEYTTAIEPCNLNAYLVLNSDMLIVTEQALAEMVERFVTKK